jgi:hypothetical protein
LVQRYVQWENNLTHILINFVDSDANSTITILAHKLEIRITHAIRLTHAWGICQLNTGISKETWTGISMHSQINHNFRLHRSAFLQWSTEWSFTCSTCLKKMTIWPDINLQHEDKADKLEINRVTNDSKLSSGTKLLTYFS